MKVKLYSIFITPYVDVKQNDIIRFANEGQETPGRWDPAKPDFQIVIRGERFEGDKILTLNNESKKNMIALYGDESSQWVMKEAVVNILKTRTGKDKIVLTAPNVNPQGDAIIQ